MVDRRAKSLSRFPRRFVNGSSTPLSARVESIPDPMHGLDQTRSLGIVLELLAQLEHVHVNRARRREVVRAPHVVEQTLAIESLAWMGQEIAQQIELLARQALAAVSA